jgi:hypothetical protein
MGRIPRQSFSGAALIAVTWPLAWSGWEPWSLYTFFPLWLGYILVIDGLVLIRTGTSPLSRDIGRFIGLFLLSAPGWWLFEVANERLQNWFYVTVEPIPRWEYAIRATIAFSTVVPAVFVTAELFRSLPALRRPVSIARFDPGPAGLRAIIVVGVFMMAAAMFVPNVAYPLVWIGAFLAIDPVNRLLGARSLSAEVAQNNWSNVLALFAAGLTCGFFWEMWNSRSMPKWIYEVPYVDMPKLFEMPLLGYGGYFPFALELFALSQLVTWLVLRRPDAYVLPDPSPSLTASGAVRGGNPRWTAEIDGSYNRSRREHAE